MREFNEQSAATQIQIAATRADIQAHQIDEYRDKIIQWLSKTDPSYNHHQACKKHQPHTGEWLIKHVDFENWKMKKGFLLWLYGKRKSLPLVMLFPVRSGFNPLRCTLRFFQLSCDSLICYTAPGLVFRCALHCSKCISVYKKRSCSWVFYICSRQTNTCLCTQSSS